MTSELEGGDRSKAMKRLRVPPLGDQVSQLVVCHACDGDEQTECIMCICMYGWMDGCMHAWMDGWIDLLSIYDKVIFCVVCGCMMCVCVCVFVCVFVCVCVCVCVCVFVCVCSFINLISLHFL